MVASPLKEVLKSYRRLKKLDQVVSGDHLSLEEYRSFLSQVSALDDAQLDHLRISTTKFREAVTEPHDPRDIFSRLSPIFDRYLKEKPPDPEPSALRKELALKLAESAAISNGSALLDTGLMLQLFRDRSFKYLAWSSSESGPFLFPRQRVNEMLRSYQPDYANLKVRLQLKTGNIILSYAGGAFKRSRVTLFPNGEYYNLRTDRDALIRINYPEAVREEAGATEEAKDEQEILIPEVIPRKKEPLRLNLGFREALIERTANLLEVLFRR